MKKLVCFALALVMVACLAFPAFAATATTNALVETEQGWLLGTNENGVNCFLGIPYATAKRFESAVRFPAWEGMRTAVTYGQSSPTGNTVTPVTDYMTKNAAYFENEDCLYLNVWSTSTDPTAKKAVMFFIHGGGYSSGSANELVYYEGENMARTQDIVFVSVNHRLNILGYTDLSNYGDQFKYSGNAGQEDLVVALEWVKENIAAFGGDPDNVTILGQSGGGGKVTSLLGTPRAAGVLFHKAIICSGGPSPNTRTTEQAAACGDALVQKCIDTYEDVTTAEEAIAKLTSIPYVELKALSSGTGVGAGPVVDGDFYPVTTVDAEGKWVDIAKDIPIIISSTIGEMAGNMGDNTINPLVMAITAHMPNPEINYLPNANKAYMSDEQKDAKLTAKYGEYKDAVVEEFLKAYPNKEAVDAVYRTGRSNNGAIYKYNQGGAPVYQCVWSWEFPCFGGVPAWHTGGDLPFIFNNMAMIDNLVAGNEEEAQKLADLGSTMFANFCKTGNPSTADVAWTPFTVEVGETMIFDTESGVRNYHDKALQEVIDSIPKK